jgi:hypothetical protein
MLTLLKTAYPRYYKDTTKEEAQNTIYLYQTMFKDEDIELILIAIKELINTFQYPPTIADIKNKMYSLQHINDPLKDNNYLWDIFSKACSHGAYNSQEEYDKLFNCDNDLTIFVRKNITFEEQAIKDFLEKQLAERNQEQVKYIKELLIFINQNGTFKVEDLIRNEELHFAELFNSEEIKELINDIIEVL